jgi:hypothetical protein
MVTNGCKQRIANGIAKPHKNTVQLSASFNDFLADKPNAFCPLNKTSEC